MPTWYCTVEDVTGALDYKSPIRNIRQVRRSIEEASAAVDDVARRPIGAFRPVTAAYSFEWPPRQTTPRWAFRFEGAQLISATSVVSGGVTISASDYFLEPQSLGPPYTRIEIDRGGSAAFSYSDTSQRSLVITGLWGFRDDRRSVGTLAASINDSVTSLTLSDGSDVGIGDHLILGSERVEVTARSFTDSGQNLGGDLTAASADDAVSVSDGTEFVEGELLLIDTERMLITDVVGNTLTVDRAVDGSALATHTTGADVYARRGCTVTRGAQGSTAASHSSGDAITRHQVPGTVWAATVGKAITIILGEQAGYSRAPGQGQMTLMPAGKDLPTLMSEVESSVGRYRSAAI